MTLRARRELAAKHKERTARADAAEKHGVRHRARRRTARGSGGSGLRRGGSSGRGRSARPGTRGNVKDVVIGLLAVTIVAKEHMQLTAGHGCMRGGTRMVDGQDIECVKKKCDN